MPDVPMRYIHFDVANKESYSLDSVGKHGFGRFFKDNFPEQNAACLSCNMFSTRSHGDWPSAARRGAVKHLHGNEIGRAAHA